ncbi:cytochrome P450 [Penicillium macrosclerotiorum]|uniref:cytochrome P450 n=1 Tax=Penicillium macrosclerotiorum TaxID=303699 RepID=UPI002549A3F6|nr:cytochrome P450 [Penicillium macrosclerotiorum]KAJ5675327.1 cytochrome P450 [Penicillium macrosclerotiorum]
MDASEDHMKVRQKYPQILGPLIWRFSSAGRSFRETTAAAKKILVPKIELQLNCIKNQKDGAVKKGAYFLLDLMINQATKKQNDLSKKDQRKLSNLIVDEALFMLLESGPPVFFVTTFVLCEIMRHPEYIGPLRTELTAALALFQGEWSLKIFNHTPRLESFTKEVLRLRIPPLLTGTRYALKDMHFPSLGTTVKAGSHVALASFCIHLDPDHYSDPTTFDGYRFYNADSETYNTRNAATPSENYLPFGIGVSTCPGSSIAVRICQLIIGKLLNDYDLGSMDEDVPFIQYARWSQTPLPGLSMKIKRRQEDSP